MIQQRDLSLISNALLKQSKGRRIPDQTIELDYALGWFLCEMSKHPYARHLAFKGGTALRRCHFGEYRFSEDLDFTLLNDDDFETVRTAFEQIAEAVSSSAGMPFRFSKPDSKPHINSHTFYMAFTGPMGREREFKVDVTRKEVITSHLDTLKVLKTYQAFDFPENRELKVYSVDEIATEKIVALTDPARTQPRDLFDIWTLVEQRDVDLASLALGIAKKLDFRGRSAEGLDAAFDRKEKSLKSTWRTRLDYQMSATPEFETVFRAVRQTLRRSNVFEATLKAINEM